jgi:hypothetical protein
VEIPDPIVTDPLFPELVVPETNERRPLAPDVPAFIVLMVTAPLVVSVPEPALTVM